MTAIKGLELWNMATPEIFVAVAAMILLLLGVFRGEKSATTIAWLAVASLAMALALVFSVPTGRGLNGLFVSNGFVVFMKALVLLASMISIIMARSYMERANAWRFEYPILVMLATLGMMLMMSANDLIALYLGLELQSLALYVIAAFQRDTVRSTEAGLKYFVLGALSSGMLLYGASLLYGFSGTTGFAGIAKAMAGGQPSLGALIGLVFLTAGLAFKISAVPFHMWTPDVYEGAPTPVTALFAVGPKIAAMSLFVSVMVGPFKPLLQQWQQIVVFISVASMLLGAFAAIAQTNIKRLMAYSSIGHVGYVLLGVAAGNEIGIRGVILYLTIYLFMNVGTFACILAMKRQDHAVESISDLAGVSRTHPLLALALAIFMFSMAGIPPLAGFFGKLYVFLAALEAGLVIAAVIGVVSSVVAAFYYLRIIKVMYFDQPGDQLDHPVERPLAAVMAVGAVITFAFGAFLAPVLGAAQSAAASLFGG